MHTDHHHDHEGATSKRARAMRTSGGFGRGDHFRGGPPMRGGRRRRRGDVRAAALVLLEEQPRNGYQLIQELGERTSGAWQPSPGSIYPVLQQLEDEGLVVASSEGSGKTFSLTSSGQALVTEQRESLGRPWEAAASGFSGAVVELMGTARQVAMAARQVVHAGSDAQIAEATAVLKEARRSIYRILAEVDDT